ncbi:MAG: DUF4956 domain-containing protein [Eggerthellaceae bacterium]|nr:DUF4956 domain-containing protein [Eggerthellaceae bacterium]
MLDTLFSSILTGSETSVSISSSAFLLCSLTSLVLGVAIAFIYMFRQEHTKNFVVTLALLPIIVQMVIALVNGNIGAGVAVMGVFNLVRFRSIPGSAKDIGAVFLAMAVGLATGMGYLGLAVVFTVIVGIANMVFVLSPLGGSAQATADKTLKVTIPEDLDYCNTFDDLFDRYTTKAELTEAKTTNMGALYQLTYDITLKDVAKEKMLLDEIRTRNGNLQVSCGRPVISKERL